MPPSEEPYKRHYLAAVNLQKIDKRLTPVGTQ